MALRTGKKEHEFDVVLQERPGDDILLYQRFRFEFDFLNEEKRASPTLLLKEVCSLDGSLLDIKDNPRSASAQDLKDAAYRRSFSSSGYGSQYSVSSDDSEILPDMMSHLLQGAIVNGVNSVTNVQGVAEKNTVFFRIVEDDALVLGGASPLNSNQAMRDYLESTIKCL